MIESFIAYMRNNGWNIEINSEKDGVLPIKITNRYTNIDKQWLEFISIVKMFSNAEETVWFLCSYEYTEYDVAFQWNEWEILSLESADDDEELQNDIKQFWDNYLPIIMSVKGGDYSYYAMSMKDGSIINGCGPEFEEYTVSANSFNDFMSKIMNNEIDL